MEAKTLEGPIYTKLVSHYTDTRGDIWTAYKSSEIFPECTHTKLNTNKRGVFRGFHSDTKTTKLVSCIKGEIVAMILSPDNLQYKTYVLSSCSHSTLLIPPGFYNGFLSVTESIYMYHLTYKGEYIDADEQQTIVLENSCMPIDEITKYFHLKDLIRSERDMPV